MRIQSAAFVVWVVMLSVLPVTGATVPTITIRLAPEIRSEDVSISCVLYGDFGAVGATVIPRENLHSYQIKPLHDGKLAASMKGVIYASGCGSTPLRWISPQSRRPKHPTNALSFRP